MSRTGSTSKRARAAAAALLLLAGCAGTEFHYATPARTFDVVVAPEWGASQDDIVAAVGVWSELFDPTVDVTITVAPCDYTEPTCIQPVEPDADVLLAAAAAEHTTEEVVGHYMGEGGGIAISNDPGGVTLECLTVHELGHRLGMRHSDNGVMSAHIERGVQPEVTPASIARLVASGWRSK